MVIIVMIAIIIMIIIIITIIIITIIIILSVHLLQAVDFLINMSKPFLEDAVDMFFGQGLLVNDPFRFPSVNEHLSINRKFLRFQTDLIIPSDLSRS